MPAPIDGLTLTQYLRAKKINYKTTEVVAGGLTNYVFRITDSKGKTCIVKHVGPFAAFSNGAFKLPDERMEFEVTAIQEVLRVMPSEMPVRVPKIWEYDRGCSVLIMTDAGRETLKAAYGRQDTNVIEIEVAEKYGLGVEYAKFIDQKYGSLLQTDNECMCMGDFWPGNVLLDEKNDKSLTVVDWEICRRGCGATDVGQFAAEAYLLDRLRGGKGLLDSFLDGYKKAKGSEGVHVGVDRQFIKRVAVHMGVHLGYWPAIVAWADAQETKAIIVLGYELMKRGDAEDMNWLRDNMLQALFRS
ncbi:MAG: hypothetical protein LQ341_002315 [Variospora aurantia]|nr:MAG: hypothetical protein LQ341_002315 [Variospora aurantia]